MIARDWAQVMTIYFQPSPKTKHIKRGKYIQYKHTFISSLFVLAIAVEVQMDVIAVVAVSSITLFIIFLL